MASNSMTDEQAMQFLNSIQVPVQQPMQQPATQGGMTDEQAMAFLNSLTPGSSQQAQAPAQPAEEPSMTQEVLAGAARGLAPAARGAIIGGVLGGAVGATAAGVGAIPGAVAGARIGSFVEPVAETVYDLAVSGINKLFGTNFQTASEMSAEWMDKLGIPRTSTAAGRIAEGISSGLSATKSAIKAGTTLANLPGNTNLVQRAAAFLSENPTQQYAAAVLAPFGGEGARQIAEASGASPEATQWAQLTGSFGGALGGGLAGSAKITKGYNLPKIEGMTQEAVQQTIKAIEDAGGTVPTSIVFRPQGRVGQFFENVNEFVNAKGRVALSEDATKNVAEMLRQFGADNPESLAQDLAESFKTSRLDAINAEKDKVKQILADVTAQGTPVDTRKTIAAINKQIAELESANKLVNAPTIDLLKETRHGLFDVVDIPKAVQQAPEATQDVAAMFRRDPVTGRPVYSAQPAQSVERSFSSLYNDPRVIDVIPVHGDPAIEARVILGKTIDKIDQNLKDLGSKFPSEKTPLDSLQKARKAIYGPLSEDIKSTIESVKGADAVKAWEKSNAALADFADELKITALKKALNTGEANPQLIDNVLFGQNEWAYKTLHENLDQQGRRVAQSRIMQRMAEKSIDSSTGEISNTRFLSNLNKNEKLINTYFTGKDKELIDGTINFLTLAAPAEKLKANPMNGSRLFLPQLGGVLAGVMTGPQGLVATAGLYGMAKLYDKPMSRELLMRLSRLKLEDQGSMLLAKRINQALVATAADRAVNDLDERKIQVAFNDRAVRKELIGKGMVLDDSVSGYRIISKDGKTARLMGPTGQVIGYFNSVDDARRRANKLTMMQLRRDTKKAYAP